MSPAPVSIAAFFLVAGLTIFWTPAGAKGVTLDDTGTQALEPAVSMHWRSMVPPRSAADNLMVGTSMLRVRINVASWLHRSGRIYLSFPAQHPGAMTLSWVSQGRLMSGKVQTGGRVLVYSGQITAPFIEDTLTMQYVVNGALLQRPTQVSYHFEWDEE